MNLVILDPHVQKRLIRRRQLTGAPLQPKAESPRPRIVMAHADGAGRWIA